MLCKTCSATNPTEFYATNKSTCKRCASIRASARYRKFFKVDQQDYTRRGQHWQDANVLRYRWLSAKSRATRKNVEFTIQPEYLELLWEQQQGLCYYSKLPMVRSRDEKTYSVSIDRIDSNKGYVEGNVTLCCSSVNMMKNKLPFDEFQTIVKALCAQFGKDVM